MDSNWMTVIAAAVASLGTGLAALFGSYMTSRANRLERRDEHARSEQAGRREERKTAYVAYLQVLHEMHYQLSTAVRRSRESDEESKVRRDDLDQIAVDIRRKLTVVRLLSSTEVRMAADVARRTLYEYYEHVRGRPASGVSDLSGLQKDANDLIKMLETLMNRELNEAEPGKQA